jgi:hypothetical protein
MSDGLVEPVEALLRSKGIAGLLPGGPGKKRGGVVFGFRDLEFEFYISTMGEHIDLGRQGWSERCVPADSAPFVFGVCDQATYEIAWSKAFGGGVKPSRFVTLLDFLEDCGGIEVLATAAFAVDEAGARTRRREIFDMNLPFKFRKAT